MSNTSLATKLVSALRLRLVSRLLSVLLGCFAAVDTAVASDFREVDSFVLELSQNYALPGALLLVIDAQGIVHEVRIGDWDLEKQVPIASASALLSSVAILRLVDRNILDLEDTVAKYIPQVVGEARSITLRQSLAKTTGQTAVFDSGITIPGPSLESSVETILSRPQEFRPGQAFTYGPTHIQIAGRLAEIATGKTWHEIFDEEVVTPLGLDGTGFGYLVGMEGPSMSLNNLRIETVGNNANPQINGGARSSASDLLKVLSMLLNRGLHVDEFGQSHRILQPDTVDMILSDQTDGAFVARSYFFDKSHRYGFGMWMMTRSETGTVYNSADGALGTIPWVDRRKGIAGLFVTLGNYSEWVTESMLLRDLVSEAVD